MSLLALIYEDPGSWSLFFHVLKQGPGLTFEEWGMVLIFGRLLWLAVLGKYGDPEG